LLKRLNKLPNLYSFPDVIAVLINIFSVSHINRKDWRIENETMEYFRGLGDNVSVNQIIKFNFVDSAEEMRLMVFNMLLKLYIQNIDDEKWTEILNLLMPSDQTSKLLQRFKLNTKSYNFY
jgi:hypothetical protein